MDTRAACEIPSCLATSRKTSIRGASSEVIRNKGDTAGLLCKVAIVVLVLSVVCILIHELWARAVESTDDVAKRIDMWVKWTLLLIMLGFFVGFFALLYVIIHKGMSDQTKKISLLCGTCGCGSVTVFSVLYFALMLGKPGPTLLQSVTDHWMRLHSIR
ncbi:unnamed protein product [Cuscuta epithymum]|uniref:Uncharacterized protein n=1 Tax=Cuscuta epithymum TaxID=186058 RepID=A0AAV0CT50_9ASTE|nr:unnamed protein product [Cuscuta epithymum]